MVQEHETIDSIRETFGPYLSTEVVNEILKSSGGAEIKDELREITILVSDIREFTRTTELLEPKQVLELINRYLEEMTDIIMKHGGTDRRIHRRRDSCILWSADLRPGPLQAGRGLRIGDAESHGGIEQRLSAPWASPNFKWELVSTAGS